MSAADTIRTEANSLGITLASVSYSSGTGWRIVLRRRDGTRDEINSRSASEAVDTLRTWHHNGEHLDPAPRFAPSQSPPPTTPDEAS